MKKRKMGKGMDVLFGSNGFDLEAEAEDAETPESKSPDNAESPEARGGISSLRTSAIEPDRKQPRTQFDDEAISELAQSVAEHGILQPILVRPVGDSYRIVAGERRWRAAMRAGLKEVPVIIKEMTELEAAQLALIENLQRESLNPVEEARGYKRLIDEFSMTQEQIAGQVSKSRSVIANSLRLLNLENEILELLSGGEISVGHAKVLAGMENREYAAELAKRIAPEKLSVREIERLSSMPQKNAQKIDKKISRVANKNHYCDEIALSLSEYFSQNVSVTERKNGRVQLKIDFKNVDELKKLAAQLAKNEE